MTKLKQINLLPFNPIKKAEFAYLLGVIASDGCIYQRKSSFTLSIELKYLDIAWLKKLKKILKIKHKIVVRVRKDLRTNAINKMCSLKASSKDIGPIFEKYNIVPRKSLTLKYPTLLSKKLNRHFIRGVLDGDGGVNIYKYKGKSRTTTVYITSASYFFLSSIKDILLENKIYSGIRVSDKGRLTGNKCYKLAINYKSLVDFYNFLYKRATVFLNRKKQKFTRIVIARKHRQDNEAKYGKYVSEKQLKLMKILTKDFLETNLKDVYSASKIAKKLGVDVVTIYNYMKNLNITPPRRRISKIDPKDRKNKQK